MALREKKTSPDFKFPLRLPVTRLTYPGFRNVCAPFLFKDNIFPFDSKSLVTPALFIPQWTAPASPENVHVKLTDKPTLLFMVRPWYDFVNFTAAKIKHISKWIYVNMASVSVYRSYVMYALGTKTLTLPTQDAWWLSTQLSNYHDNYCQQGPDWAGSGKVQTRYLPVKAFSEHCCLLKGLCQNSSPPHPTFFAPQGLIHSPSVRAVPGLSSCTDQDGEPPTFLDTALAWSRAAPGARRKPSGHVWTKSDRFAIVTTKYNNTDIEREICMAVYNGESMKVYDIKYTKMIQQNCLDSINPLFSATITEYFGHMRLIHLFRPSVDRFI